MTKAENAAATVRHVHARLTAKKTPTHDHMKSIHPVIQSSLAPACTLASILPLQPKKCRHTQPRQRIDAEPMAADATGVCAGSLGRLAGKAARRGLQHGLLQQPTANRISGDGVKEDEPRKGGCG